MKILAIDTSCDETSAAVTNNLDIKSNVIWCQASLHSKFGGVYPTLAKRMHKERIDFVINKALTRSQCKIKNIDAIAITIGPGLAPSLEVGISKAKELALKNNLPVIPVNHLEGHIFSFLSEKKQRVKTDKLLKLPFYAVVISGGNTQLIKVMGIGKYKILATTLDDALGEALDKAARLLGFGYPGASIMEEMAKKENNSPYILPVPMVGKESYGKYSYSGLKTSFVRLISQIEDEGSLNKKAIEQLSFTFQDTAFKHFMKVTEKTIESDNKSGKVSFLAVGGGVGANIEIRKRLRAMSKRQNLQFYYPTKKRLYTDNAAMIGLVGFLKCNSEMVIKSKREIENLDRLPKLKLNQNIFAI